MNFTAEQKSDIRAAYQDAKNPNKQIGILADLYACRTSDIREVLNLPKKRTLQSYDQATKDHLIKAVIVDGQSISSASEQSGIPFSTIAGWVAAARKKQKEFLDYAQEIQPQQPTAESDLSPQQIHSPVKFDLEQLQKSLTGLGQFMLAFDDFDFLTSEQLHCLDELLIKTDGFLQGIKVATQL